MMMYEVFSVKSKVLDMSSKINTLFGYPKAGKSIRGKIKSKTMTEKYRYIITNKDEDTWGAPIGEELVAKCANMTKKDRDKYYESSNLHPRQFLIDSGLIYITNT